MATRSERCSSQAHGEIVLKDESISTISPWAWLLQRSDLVAILRRNLAQAELSWSVGRVTLLMLLAGAAAPAGLIPEDWAAGGGAAARALAVAGVSCLFVLRRRSRRHRH